MGSKNTEEQKQGDDEESILGKVKEFCLRTTAHGYERIASSKSAKGKIVWSTCVLASLLYMIFQGAVLVSDYLNYPVDIKVELQYIDGQNFPAVVVCNMNAAKYSELKRLGMEGITTTAWKQADDHGYRSVKSFKTTWLASLNVSDKRSLGHQVEDFILDCTWKGEPCGKENFTFFYNFVYGNCYVFGDQEMRQATVIPGSENGLSLILNIESDEYMCDFTESYGVIIDVTNPTEMHFPEEKGILVTPGQMTSIGVTSRIVERLSLPYEGKACGYEEGEKQLMYEGKRYSETACRKTCVAERQQQFCGCADVAYPLKPNCDPFNKTQNSCARNVTEQIRTSNLSCNCKPDCKQVIFPPSISSTTWPTAGYLPRLQYILGNRAAEVTRNLTEVRKNLARVDVYFKTMTVEVVTQEPRYSRKDLLSSIGGSLGLFTGMSVLTVLDFFKLALDIVKVLCRRLIKQLFKPKCGMRTRKTASTS